MSGEVLSLAEVAQALGVHYMTAYRYVRLGQLPATKIRSVWQVDRSDLDGYLERGSTVTSPAPGRLGEPDRGGSSAATRPAWAVIEAAHRRHIEPVEVYTEALGPALRSIRERWAKATSTPGRSISLPPSPIG